MEDKAYICSQRDSHDVFWDWHAHGQWVQGEGGSNAVLVPRAVLAQVSWQLCDTTLCELAHAS